MTEFKLIEGDVVLRDMAGNPALVVKEGKLYQVAAYDQTSHDLLSQILTELKKMNVHLSLINSESVKDSDVDG